MAKTADKTIFRSKRKKNFTVLSNELIDNPSLSAKAKWVLIYLLSKPEDWQTRTSDIVKHCTDGEAAIKSALKELKQSGYMQKVRVTCPDTGKVLRWETLVFDEPQAVPDSAKSPEVENPPSGIPPSGNPPAGKSTTTKDLDLPITDQENVSLTRTTTKETKGSSSGKSKGASLFEDQWSTATQEERETAEDNAFNAADMMSALGIKLTDGLIKACLHKQWHEVLCSMYCTLEGINDQKVKLPQVFLEKAIAGRWVPSKPGIERYIAQSAPEYVDYCYKRKKEMESEEYARYQAMEAGVA